MKTISLRLSLSLCAALALVAAPLAAFSLEESREAALKLERVTENRLAPGERVELSDSEFNSYIHYQYAREMPEGVRGLRVRFDRDIGVVNAVVDFSKVTEDGDSPGSLLMMLLRGEREVVARVRYTSSRGMGTADIESFQVDGREMKGQLLDWLVDRYVTPNMDGFALGEPAPLGHNLRQVRLDRGAVTFIAENETADE